MSADDHRVARDQARSRIDDVSAKLSSILSRFGNHLATREEYDGMEAVWLYLIRTHHWTPSYMKSLHPDDLRLTLDVEMRDLKASSVKKA